MIGLGQTAHVGVLAVVVLAHSVADTTAASLPFQSISIQDKRSKFVTRWVEHNQSPYLKNRDETTINNVEYRFLSVLDKGKGVLGGGPGGVTCIVDEQYSSATLVYEIGATKVDQFSCDGNKPGPIRTRFNISYETSASFDGSMLAMSGQMKVSGKRTLNDQTVQLAFTYTEDIAISINGKKCTVVRWRRNTDKTESSPQTRRYYSYQHFTYTRDQVPLDAKCIVS